VLDEYRLILKFNAVSKTICLGLGVAVTLTTSFLIYIRQEYATLLLVASSILMATSALPLALLKIRGRPRSGIMTVGILKSVWGQLRLDRLLALLFFIYSTVGFFSVTPLLFWIFDFYGYLELAWGTTLIFLNTGGIIGGLLSARVGMENFFRIVLLLPLPAVIIGIMIIRQISKNKAGKHYEQVKAESEIKNYDKSQPNEKMDGDLSWLDNYKNASKDFTTQEKKSTEKPEENTKSEGIPEFFLDKEKESEEKK